MDQILVLTKLKRAALSFLIVGVIVLILSVCFNNWDGTFNPIKANEELNGFFVKYPLGSLLIIISCLCFVFHYIAKYFFDKNTFDFTEQLSKDHTENKPFIFLFRTLADLNKGILKYNVLGFLGVILTLIVIALFGLVVFKLFQDTTNNIKPMAKFENWALLSIIYILRSSLLGTLLITTTIYSFKFTNSCFDQAVRFNKRKHATMFLVQVLHNENLHQNNMSIIMQAFKEWNVSVESAFTTSSSKGEQEAVNRLTDKLIDGLLKSKESEKAKES